MSLFDWAAPIFHRFADRWSEEHIADIAAKLAPYLGDRRAVLDLGGGTGALAVRIAEAFPATVTVLDPSPKMVSIVMPASMKNMLPASPIAASPGSSSTSTNCISEPLIS